MKELEELLIERIKKDGPVSFHDYMETALYHSRFGYYSCGKERIGAGGDYYTSPALTSVLGEMLAVQIEEAWALMGRKPVTVVEYGAGNGMLCRDIINGLNEKNVDVCNYYIIERNGKQIDTGVIDVISSIDELEPFHGVVLSNELVDNFSVHRVKMQQQLMEVYVDYQDGFKEILLPAPKTMEEYFQHLNVTLPEGFCAEINLQAKDWLKGIAEKINCGFVITIDYGYTSSELNANRRMGTVTCFSKHTVSDNIYSNIGEQDITAHVNFSAISHFGKNYGLQCCGYTDQLRFLQGLGLTDYIRKKERQGIIQADLLFLHQFLMDMGRKFKVLIQQKGLVSPFLSGLRFAEKI